MAMRTFTEKQAAIVMKQILRGVFYMHEKKTIHRDLKPDNFLFANDDPLEECILKMIDFGFACKVTEDNMGLTTKSGTPHYIAPEVLAGGYGQKADLWSCGVILYVLICGSPPFQGKTDHDVLQAVRRGELAFNDDVWNGVSDDAKNLIELLLKR